MQMVRSPNISGTYGSHAYNLFFYLFHKGLVYVIAAQFFRHAVARDSVYAERCPLLLAVLCELHNGYALFADVKEQRALRAVGAKAVIISRQHSQHFGGGLHHDVAAVHVSADLFYAPCKQP